MGTLVRTAGQQAVFRRHSLQAAAVMSSPRKEQAPPTRPDFFSRERLKQGATAGPVAVGRAAPTERLFLARALADVNTQEAEVAKNPPNLCHRRRAREPRRRAHHHAPALRHDGRAAVVLLQQELPIGGPSSTERECYYV